MSLAHYCAKKNKEVLSKEWWIYQNTQLPFLIGSHESNVGKFEYKTKKGH